MAPNKKGHPCPEKTFAVMLLPSLRLIPFSPSRPRHYGLITSLLFPDLPPPPRPPGQAQDMDILRNLPPKVKARDDLPVLVMQQVSLFLLLARRSKPLSPQPFLRALDPEMLHRATRMMRRTMASVMEILPRRHAFGSRTPS
jgi:hypothetical protein